MCPTIISKMPSGMALIVTLRDSNYLCLEQIFMVPKGFEPSKFDCIGDILWKFFFYHENVCWVDSLELLHWGNSNNYSLHVIIYRKLRKALMPIPFASWPGAMINSQWFELSISTTNFHGPNDVRAVHERYIPTMSDQRQSLLPWCTSCIIANRNL